MRLKLLAAGIPTATSPDGATRKARPPATHDTPVQPKCLNSQTPSISLPNEKAKPIFNALDQTAGRVCRAIFAKRQSKPNSRYRTAEE
jgi:hypothetical protein